MNKSPLDRFGELLMTRLRDRAIEHQELIARGHYRAPGLKELQALVGAQSPDVQALILRCVTESVDSAIHDFLFTIQEHHDHDGSVDVLIGGQSVADASDGLHGEPYGDGGWQARFSRYPRYET